MQYGNLQDLNIFLCDDIEFKSYYVVWKRVKRSSTTDGTVQFKSYYVVWKLMFFRKKNSLEIQFKSYYVVWKPRAGGSFACGCECLNRTMQYGNTKYSIKLAKYFSRLNRTMQYGNQELINDSEIPREFKSYYVVWKRFPRLPSNHPLTSFKSYYVVWKQVEGQDIFQGNIWV